MKLLMRVGGVGVKGMERSFADLEYEEKKRREFFWIGWMC